MVSKLPIIWKQTVARENGEEVSESDEESQEVVEMRGRSRLAHEERGDLVKKGMEIPSVTTEEFESWWIARTEAKRLRARKNLASTAVDAPQEGHEREATVAERNSG